jgi:hypothetical protein
MKRKIKALLLATGIILAAHNTEAQTNPFEKDPWTAKQLMEPEELASMIKNPKAEKPLILNIGVVDDIKGAKNIGPVSNPENQEKLKKAVIHLSKDVSLVFYCGCCPFNKCPNIRPAFKLISEMGFKHAYLLNLATNIKVDWINKGFPLDK